MTSYADFLATKLATSPPTGFVAKIDDPALFPFQCDLVTWALRRGRAALFADTGLGKTRMQLHWARAVQAHTGGRVLILAPLSVAKQTAAEGEACGVQVRRVSHGGECAEPGIYVTNYDKLHKFPRPGPMVGTLAGTSTPVYAVDEWTVASDFAAVVLDESSIIKHHDAKTLANLLDRFRDTPFKLCASATPSPNDYTELGTHAEFFGVCTRSEMLAEFFCHDGGDTSVWRLKGHARQAFWRWVSSWAAMLRKPSDLGYDDAGYDLPHLHVHEHRSDADPVKVREAGLLFAEPASTLTERRAARRATMGTRIEACASLIMGHTCGIQNTTKLGEESTQRTRRTAQSAPNSREHPKRTRNTCANTTSRTPKSSSVRQSSRQIETPIGEPSTQLTPHTETSSRPKSDNTTQVGQEPSSPSAFESMGSPSNGTTSYFASSVIDVPSAEPNSDAQRECRGSTSTIATPPELSEGYSADDATSVSDSSTTTRIDSSVPQCTCGASEKWIVWAELNDEQESLARLLGSDCVSITGTMTTLEKELRMDRFLRGEVRVLLSKPRICGWGINLQFACHMAFIGVTDSFESYYQATRRIWRFGQKRECHVHLFYNELEGDVLRNLKRKGDDARKMGDELSAETREMVQAEVRGARRETNPYAPGSLKMPVWLTKREAEYE
jgi:hypothetical protein